MNKTLDMHLAGYKQDIVASMWRFVLKDIKDDHPSWCHHDLPDDVCTCPLGAIVRHVENNL